LEAEFKKALACESGAQGILFDEKTKGRKFYDTVPLMLSNKIYSNLTIGCTEPNQVVRLNLLDNFFRFLADVCHFDYA
jgi:hypothetical protein